MSTTLESQLRARARALLASGAVEVFLGYRQGSSPLKTAPFAARTPAEAERLVWNPVCVANLASALRKHAGKRVGVALKACDARSVAELLKLNQLDRARLHLVAVACDGMVDPDRVAAATSGAVSSLGEADGELLIGVGETTTRHAKSALLLAKCAGCAPPPRELCDELLGEGVVALDEAADDRFARVHALEALDPAARFAFWSEQLSRCTLCYACQTACPLCYCKECALTLERGDPRRLAREPGSVFSFHVMRAYHLAERCTGCDECERVCPEGIPLSLITRKLELDRGNS